MDDDLRGIAHRALPLVHLPLLRHQPGARYAEQEGIRLAAYDLPLPGLNAAAVVGASPPPARVLALAEAFFADCWGGWGIVVEADAGHHMEAALRAWGWPIAQEHPAMVLPELPVPPPPPAGLHIRRVIDEAGLADWFAAPFARPPAGSSDRGDTRDDTRPDRDAGLNDRYHRLLVPSVDVALDPAIALFTGYADGQPVGTAALYCIDGIAELGGIFTARPYRRRGFGAALTWAALAEGASRGCQAAALNASPDGYPVYRRLGFRRACTFRRYTAP